MPEEAEPIQAPAAKASRRVPRAVLLAPPLKRWALVVGISGYRDERLDLKYAARDAERFVEVLQSERCGKFERIVSLIDPPVDRRRRPADGDPTGPPGQATAEAIRKVLVRDFAGAGPDDLVLLYFSCHGGPDLKRTPNVMYFLTQDTDPDDIAGTALRMDEVQRALQDGYIRARCVLIFLDTCHSGFAGAIGIKAVDQRAQATIDYLQRAHPSEGVAWLTSAEGGESSFEDARWGGGHGVFTHYLLEGLGGKADGYSDRIKDGVVSVDELFKFVQEQVRNDPHAKGQNPHIRMDGWVQNLIVAYTADRDAGRLHRVGVGLLDAGLHDDEPAHIVAATELLATANRRIKAGEPVIELDLGRSLLACRRNADAESVLTKLWEAKREGTPARAGLYLGIARARLGQHESAAAALESFASEAPDDAYADFARSFGAMMRQRVNAPRRALLIGVNQYRAPHMPRTEGQDLALMRDLLENRLGFRHEDVTVLADAQATRAKIRGALRRLAAESDAGTLIWVYFSGLAMGEEHELVRSGREPGQLLVHDSSATAGSVERGLALSELHAAMKKLPALNKALILDTHISAEFARQAEADADYTLWTAVRPGAIAYIRTFHLDEELVNAGVFTGAWIATFRSIQHANDVTNQELHRSLRAEVAASASGIGQESPQLIGNAAQTVFGRTSLFLDMWDLTQRRSFLDLRPTDIGRSYRRLTGLVSGKFTPWHAGVGRAFLSHGLHEPAQRALAKAHVRGRDDEPAILLALARARLGGKDWKGATACFRRIKAVPAIAGGPPDIETLIALTRRMAAAVPRALVIGVERYESNAIDPAEGAEDDARSLAKALSTHMGFAEGEIRTLLGTDARRLAIETEVRALAEHAQESAGFLFFAGNGSTVDGQPAILPFDARLEGVPDIGFAELRSWIGPHAGNVVAIVDAGWTNTRVTLAGARHIPMADRGSTARADLSPSARSFRFVVPSATHWPTRRDIMPASRQEPSVPGQAAPSMAGRQQSTYADSDLKLGGVTVLNGSIRIAEADEIVPLARPGIHDGKPGGELTDRVLRWLRASSGAATTRRELEDALADPEGLQPWVWADRPDRPLVGPNRLLDQADARILALERANVGFVGEELNALVSEKAVSPSLGVHAALLDLAMSEAQPVESDGKRERTQSAIESLRRALARLEVETSPDQGFSAEAAEADEGLRDRVLAGRYHLGRALYACNDDLEEAVRQLRLVRKERPDDPRAGYYLGRALLAISERDLIREAQALLEAYLAQNAPLGDSVWVEETVDRLKSAGTRWSRPSGF